MLEPGDGELGWLAQSGRVPLGYLGDPAKTAATFPEVDGRPPRRGRRPGPAGGPTARIELHGRDSVCINTGGEKVFAEEVETALKTHAAVLDAVVCGRPSPRWGEEVVALVAAPARPGPDRRRPAGRGRAQHVARYKLPKQVVRLDRLVRSPSGKADYRWARTAAAEATAEEAGPA